MIIKRQDIKKYLLSGCVVKLIDGSPSTVKGVGGNFYISANNKAISFNDIKEIISYKIPTDIETNIAYIEHYIKLKNPSDMHSGHWFHNYWAMIYSVNNIKNPNKYLLGIEYCDGKKTYHNESKTVISKNQIDVYNPFCPGSLLIEEDVIGEKILHENVFTNQQIKFLNSYTIKTTNNKLDFGILLNKQKIILDQYN